MAITPKDTHTVWTEIHQPKDWQIGIVHVHIVKKRAGNQVRISFGLSYVRRRSPISQRGPTVMSTPGPHVALCQNRVEQRDRYIAWDGYLIFSHLELDIIHLSQ